MLCNTSNELILSFWFIAKSSASFLICSLTWFMCNIFFHEIVAQIEDVFSFINYCIFQNSNSKWFLTLQIYFSDQATDQETRLITTGRFKDQQRANVKLAVKFMVSNYRLSDNIIRSSAFIVDNTKRTKASVAGQAAVQNLFTILEYFDSADVQNIKVRESYFYIMHYFIVCV